MSVIVTDIEQGTPEWFNLRKEIPTASNFNRILTATTLKPSSQATKYMAELIAKTHGAENESFYSSHMAHGHEYEPEARAWYELDNMVKVKEVAFVYGDKSRTFGASPDGLINKDGGIEIKCPKLETHIGYHLSDGGVPVDYLHQVYGCLFVTGRKWWDFLSYHPGGWDAYLVRTSRSDPKYASWEAKFGPVLTEFLQKLAKSKHQLDPMRPKL